MTRRQRSYPVAPPGLWDREDMRSALAARDMGAVITIFRRWTGASQTDIGVLLGMPQPHVSDFERGIRHATSLAMFERLADGLGIPRPLLGLADSQHDHDEAAPGRTREEPSREILAIRSVDFVAWLAEQSKTSFRVIYDRLAARIQQLARIQTRNAAIAPTCMAGSHASKSSPRWPSTIGRCRRTAPSTTCRWMA